ncbi:MAG: hypothetical protein K5867_02555 [Bacteroidales bacterium]|nr:hypothetical protein [Bacteroidales bacterium]
MNKPSEDEMIFFSQRLNHLLKTKKISEAKAFIWSECKKYPEEFFLWTSLTQTCLRLGENELAIKYSNKAMELCGGDDDLVLYNHICSLVNNKMYTEALPYCEIILKKSIDAIADKGDGVRWAKSIRNDTMYLKAVCLSHSCKNSEALCLFEHLLTIRQRGVYSDFSKRQIIKKISILKNDCPNNA